jgi:hypothetical protein
MYGGRSGRAKGKTPKGKKAKCPICDTKGHTKDDCPKREDTTFQLKAKTGAGSGFSHKTSHKASQNRNKNGGGGTSGEEHPHNGNNVALPFGVQDVDDDYDHCDDNSTSPPFFCFDAGCDVAASLDSLATLQGSAKKAMATYQAALTEKHCQDLYGGCICRQLLKPGRPWKADAPRTKMMLEADPHTFFVVGLGPGFLLTDTYDDDDTDTDDDDDDDGSPLSDAQKEDEDEDFEEAVDALCEAMDVDDRVVGVYAKLDYAPEMLEFPGYDQKTQLRRLRATCTAAMQANVPIQCRVSPGASAAADKQDTNDAHKMAMKDLAKVLVEMTPPPPLLSSSSSANKNDNNRSLLLRVHLVCWNGTSDNLLKILKAFPDTVYVGMNAAVGFAKAALAHECAFEVPLDRLLLETDAPNTIPAPVVTCMGRKAYCHSGYVPFVAAAISEHKKNSAPSTTTAIDVARIASENTVALYGKGIAERQKEAAVEAKARAELLAAQKLLMEEEEELADGGAAAAVDAEDSELAAQQLLEEMAAMAVMK